MTAVLVAFIGMVGVVAAAFLAAWLPGRRSRKTIGQSNGLGTVVEMLENSLTWQALHQEQDRQFQVWVSEQLGIAPPVITSVPVHLRHASPPVESPPSPSP